MPITIAHQPPAGVIAQSAYLGGLGQFRERRRAEDMALLEMALRDNADQRRIAANERAQLRDLASRDALDQRNFQQALFRDWRQDLSARQRFDYEQQAQAARDKQVFDQQLERDVLGGEIDARNYYLEHMPPAPPEMPAPEVPPESAVPPMPEDVADTQQAVDMNRRAVSLPSMREREALLGRIRQGHPMAVQEGLRRGMLAYSPEQQTKIRQLRKALDDIGTDNTLSPADRVRAERILAQELHSIRPMEVPVEQQPMTDQEMLDGAIKVYVDPRDGKKHLISFDRNGVPKPIEFGTDKQSPPKEPQIKPLTPMDRQTMYNNARKALYDMLPEDKEGKKVIPEDFNEQIEREVQKFMGEPSGKPVGSTSKPSAEAKAGSSAIGWESSATLPPKPPAVPPAAPQSAPPPAVPAAPPVNPLVAEQEAVIASAIAGGMPPEQARGRWLSPPPAAPPTATGNWTREKIEAELAAADPGYKQLLGEEFIAKITPELVNRLAAEGHPDPVGAAAEFIENGGKIAPPTQTIKPPPKGTEYVAPDGTIRRRA